MLKAKIIPGLIGPDTGSHSALSKRRHLDATAPLASLEPGP